TIMALGEASVLAHRSGLDLEKMWSLLDGGYAGSTLLKSRHRKLVDGEYSASGMAKYMTKDLAFATDVATGTQTNTALLPTLSAAFDELVSAGYGDDDISVARRFIEERGL